MKNNFFAFIIYATFPFSSQAASDVKSVSLTNDGLQEALGLYAEFFEDPGGELKLEDILKPEHSATFKPCSKIIPHFGYSRSAYWIRLQIRNNLKSPNTAVLGIINNTLENVSAYLIKDAWAASLGSMGRDTPINQRIVKNRNFIFKLPLHWNEQGMVYIRVKSRYSLPLPMIAGSMEQFYHYDHGDQIVFGLLYGLMLCMIFIYVLVYLFLMERHYLYFVLMIVGYIGFHVSLNGFGFEYLWPSFSWWNNRCVHFFIGMMAFFGIGFIVHFFNAPVFSPALHKFLRVQQSLSLGLMAFIFFTPYIFYVSLSAVLGLSIPTVSIVLSIMAIRKRHTPVEYFFLAWILFLGFIIYFVMMCLGVLPYNTSLIFIAQVKGVFLILFFSLALASKIRSIQSEKQEAMKQLHRHEKRLYQADKLVALGTLVASVAHEINNPNNTILLNLESHKRTWESIISVLNEYFKENGEFTIGSYTYSDLKLDLPESIEKSIKSSKKIKNIVADLRAFSREDKGGYNEQVDCRAVVQSAVKILENSIQRYTKNFKVTYDENMPTIKGNVQKLEQVVINLIQNACQALDNPNQAIEVSTLFHRENREVGITVKDQGKGMDKDTLSHVFDPFFTTKEKKEGTGLGMSISHNLVKKHGGRMVIESVPGKGTSVQVIFSA